MFGQDIYARVVNLFDDRPADENHLKRIFFQCGGAEENVASKLAAVAVAKHGHIEKFEGILLGIFDLVGEKNRAGAGAEDGAVVFGEFENGVVKAFFFEELELGSGFAAGENEAIAALEIGDGADFDGFGAELVEHFGVGLEVTLDG